MRISLTFGLIFLLSGLLAQPAKSLKWTPAGSGWAQNSINVVVFRKNALFTHRDTQFIAYYDPEGFVVLGKRRTGAAGWQLRRTPYQGRTADAHNSISIVVDGDGYVHMAWDHHNDPLRYCRSIAPGSLELTDKLPMTGELEDRVTYPEFYRLPNGDLLFLYRDGQSGRGNLVINRYDLRTRTWSKVQRNLIGGEEQRNAYWQACVDRRGVIHVSWVWRESPDVASNHDLAYARSEDGGTTWEKSDGNLYQLPITAATAEYACRIPQQHELINQTSMTADENGNPFIVSYWRESGDSVPQYHLVFKQERRWIAQNLGFRRSPFSLSGGGTKRIPISRPQILCWRAGSRTRAAVLFRDEERGSRISLALNRDIRKNRWSIRDLWRASVGSWEPSFDTGLWETHRVLNLFVQRVEQGDAEGLTGMPAQIVGVLEWRPVN